MTLSKKELLEPLIEPVWRGEVDGVGEVCIREATGDDFEFVTEKPAGREVEEAELMARYVVIGLCDDDARPLFDRGDVERVVMMPMRRLIPLAKAVREHSGIYPLKEGDDAGNSPTTTPNGSGTA